MHAAQRHMTHAANAAAMQLPPSAANPISRSRTMFQSAADPGTAAATSAKIGDLIERVIDRALVERSGIATSACRGVDHRTPAQTLVSAIVGAICLEMTRVKRMVDDGKLDGDQGIKRIDALMSAEKELLIAAPLHSSFQPAVERQLQMVGGTVFRLGRFFKTLTMARLSITLTPRWSLKPTTDASALQGLCQSLGITETVTELVTIGNTLRTMALFEGKLLEEGLTGTSRTLDGLQTLAERLEAKLAEFQACIETETRAS